MVKIFADKKTKLIIFIGFLILFTIGVFLFSKFKIQNSNEKNIQKEEFSIVAGVVPHHLLAKKIINEFFSYISSKEKPETIILLSPDHFHAGFVHGSSFITLDPEIKEFYGIKVNGSLIKNLSNENLFVFSKSIINRDHGITNLLPFIRNYFPGSEIVPVIIPFNISRERIEKFVNSLNSLAPNKTVVIASVDFSHYLPSLVAEFHDIKSIRTLIKFEKENFENLDVDSWQALYISRAFAHLKDKEFPKIIAYANSTEFAKNSVTEETTSYFSVVFENEKQKEQEKIKELEGKTILFVGDIMLDRGVEYLIRKNSVFYPFKKSSQFLKGIDIVVGNLEGPIVENPPNFGEKSLKFAFSTNVVKGLSFANFNLLSLANNHTLDMDKAGFEQTKEFLAKANINFVGHPIRCDKDFFFEKDDIIFLAFNKTFPFNCSDEKIIEIVKKIKSSNPEKFLVIIFHWGEEYHSKSLTSQQKLAHQIIDAGADLIIGSHSHVVQEIEEYKGKLIFYSLGNFIFDQYFSKETQQGLAVGLEIYPEKVIYRLFPIQSHLSQPFLMEQEKAKLFFEKLAKKSSPHLTNKIKDGSIEIEM